MLKPGKPRLSPSTNFAVTDIENRAGGELLSIVWHDGQHTVRFQDWGQWLEHVAISPHTTIYAHNGGGWDWLSLIRWMIDRDRFRECVCIPDKSGKLILVRVRLRNRVVTLADSLRLLLCSLDTAAATFAPEMPKLKLPRLPEWYFDHDRATFWRYAERDCHTLYRVMTRFVELVHSISPIGEIGPTISSTALKSFRTKYLAKPLGVPEDEELKRVLRLGYRGGRVEVFRYGVIPKVNVYDVNSMYLSVMHDIPLPVSGKAVWTYAKDFDTPGIYHVRFAERQRNKPPLLMVRGKGERVGEGWYFTPELRRFNGTLEVLGGYRFRDVECLFREWAEVLWRLRCEHKGRAMDAVAKLLGNGTYGKFGQSETCNTIEVCGSQRELLDHIATGRNPILVDEERGIVMLETHKAVPHQHVGIAGMITSEARARLWELMDADTVYCDTDSVHTSRRMKLVPGLGGLKLEASGRGVYAGKKMYCIQTQSNTKIRVKGVRVGGELGCLLSFNDLAAVAGGERIECRYRSSPTTNAVLRGGTPCHLRVERKRTLQRT
jgi:hypothetical protein